MDWKPGCWQIVDVRLGLELSHVGGIYRKGRVCSQGAEKDSTMKAYCRRVYFSGFDRSDEERDIRWFYITKF